MGCKYSCITKRRLNSRPKDNPKSQHALGVPTYSAPAKDRSCTPMCSQKKIKKVYLG